MATTVASFICTIPAGTSPFGLHNIDLNLGTNEVQQIHWRVPPGPRGLMGWYLAMSGVQVLPNTSGTLVIADGQEGDWSLDALPDSGMWQFKGYNTGTFDHAVYLDFLTAPATAGIVLTGAVIDGFPQLDADIPTMWLA